MIHQLITVSLAGHHKQEAEGTEGKNLFKSFGRANLLATTYDAIIIGAGQAGHPLRARWRVQE